MENSEISIFSFDIFDTLITRTTDIPEGIFEIMQMHIDDIDINLPEQFKDEFALRRIQADYLARQKFCDADTEEITIEQIYIILSWMYGLQDLEIRKFIEFEKQVEINNVVPIRENIHKVNLLAQKGMRVVTISDMYLDKSTIKEMLKKAGLTKIDIFVSSESKKCKWTGNMYRYLCNEYGFAYNIWSHMGDNIKSDYEVPKTLGIKVAWYNSVAEKMRDEIVKEKYYNQILLDHSYDFLLKKEDSVVSLEMYKKTIPFTGLKVAIYGAGKLGEYIHKKLNQQCNIVLWVDQWYKECRMRGLEVDSPETLKNRTFDYVIVAVVDDSRAKQIISKIIHMNVLHEKIVWIDNF